MKTIYTTIVIVFLINTIHIKAQNKPDYKKIYQQAESFIRNGKLNDAIPYFDQLLKTDSNNANWNFRLGFCLLNTLDRRQASVAYLEKAVANVSEKYTSDFKTKTAPVDAYLYMAKSYQTNYKFEEAKNFYLKYKKAINATEKEKIQEIDGFIEECNNGEETLKHPVNITQLNIGAGINSPFNDYSPVVSADEQILIFTSRRETNTGGKLATDGMYFEDIYISHKENGMWTPPSPISKNINSPGHEASVGISLDNKKILIYKDFRGNGDIYESNFTGNDWTKPAKLPKEINSKYKENHASLSSDGKRIYFASTRSGGFGGSDIWMCEKIASGKWSKAKNLGKNINTKNDEFGPNIHPDDSTLYFSSNGHNTLGGQDIFYSKIQPDKSWGTAINIGYPINTPLDDVYYMPTLNEKRAYYSSVNTNNGGLLDIYVIEYADKSVKEISVLSGTIASTNGENLGKSKISVIDPDTQDTITTQTTNENGDFAIVLKPHKRYYILYEAKDHVFFSEQFKMEGEDKDKTQNIVVALQPITLGKTSQESYLEFEKSDSTLSKTVQMELDNVSKMVKSNPLLLIHLNRSNNKLSLARYSAVYADLINNQLDSSQIKTKIDETLGDDVSLRTTDLISSDILTETYTILFNKDNTDITNDSKQIVTRISGYMKQNNELLAKTDQFDKFLLTNVQYEVLKNIFTLQGIPTERILSQNFTADTLNRTGKIVFKENTPPKGIYTFESVYFNYNKPTTEGIDANIQKIVNIFHLYPGSKIEIAGYSDAQGTEAYNKELAVKRAFFIQNELINAGIEAKNINSHGYGKANPVASNETEEGRKFNRRADITIVTPNNKRISSVMLNIPEKYDLRYTLVLAKQQEPLEKNYFYQYKKINDLNVTHTSTCYVYSIGAFYKENDAQNLKNELENAGLNNIEIIQRYELQNQKTEETHLAENNNVTPLETKYTIQIMALSRKIDKSYFKNLSSVTILPSEDNLYHYVCGEYNTYEEAELMRKQIVAKGYPDAFIKKK